jgi:hypothetical protein
VRTSLELLLLSLQLHKLLRSLPPLGLQFCLALGTHLGYMRTLLSTSGFVFLDELVIEVDFAPEAGHVRADICCCLHLLILALLLLWRLALCIEALRGLVRKHCATVQWLQDHTVSGPTCILAWT